MKWLHEQWLTLSEANRKRIVSFFNTFVSNFLLLLGAQLAMGFPASWTIFGALMVASVRGAFKEALDLYFRP